MARKKTRLEVLRGVRELLKNKSRWCKFLYYSSRSKAFCLTGAINQISNKNPKIPADSRPYARAMDLNRNYWGIVSFNDHPSTTHKDVLKAIDRGIRKLEQIRAKRSLTRR